MPPFNLTSISSAASANQRRVTWSPLDSMTSHDTGDVRAPEPPFLLPVEICFLIVGGLFAMVIILALCNIILHMYLSSHGNLRHGAYTDKLYSVSSFLDTQGPFSKASLFNPARRGIPGRSYRKGGYPVKLSVKSRPALYI
jgi:hypothetical protein